MRSQLLRAVLLCAFASVVPVVLKAPYSSQTTETTRTTIQSHIPKDQNPVVSFVFFKFKKDRDKWCLQYIVLVFVYHIDYLTENLHFLSRRT